MEKFYIDKWFHFYKTTDSFEYHKDKEYISPDSICFLAETHQIYTQDTFFGISSKDFAQLQQLAESLQQMITEIIGDESSEGNGIIDTLEEIKAFLQGYSEDDNLKVLMDSMDSTLKKMIEDVSSDLQRKYEELKAADDQLTRALYEQVNLLKEKINTNNTEVAEHRLQIKSLTQQLTNHIAEWTEFRAAYNVFYNFAQEQFGLLDGYYHDLLEKYTDVHLEIERIISNLGIVQDKTNSMVSEIEQMHQTVDRMEETMADYTNRTDDFLASKGKPDGLAPLDSEGKVPQSYLPSYVDDVQEYDSKEQFPPEGESGKIYVAKDTNLTYRWSGSTYVEISQSIALGETASTAYPGDKGKAVSDKLDDHVTDYDNPHNVTKEQLGLEKAMLCVSRGSAEEIAALEKMIEGTIVYNTDTHQYMYYAGELKGWMAFSALEWNKTNEAISPKED